MNLEQPTKEEVHHPEQPREGNPETFQSLPPQIHQTQLQKHIDKINKFTTKVVGPTNTITGLIIRINNYIRFQPPYEFHTSSLGRRIVETHQYFIDSIYFHLCNLRPIPKPRGYRQPSPPLTPASLSMINQVQTTESGLDLDFRTSISVIDSFCKHHINQISLLDKNERRTVEKTKATQELVKNEFKQWALPSPTENQTKDYQDLYTYYMTKTIIRLGTSIRLSREFLRNQQTRPIPTKKEG